MARYANRQAASHCCHSSFLTYFLTKGIKMLKPSKKHYLRYDAQTYEKDGFIKVSGKVRKLALKPRFWQVTATAKTQDPSTGEVQEKHFKF